MSRSVSSTRVVLAVGAVASALVLAGCGAGQITQTGAQVSGVDGASANVGQIAVRAASFPFTGDGKVAAIYRSGAAAPLNMTVVNFGGQADKLTGASSPVAASVNITGDGTVSPGKLLLVEGQPAQPPAATSGSAQATPSAGATTEPGSSAQAQPGGQEATATPTGAATAIPSNVVAPSSKPAPEATAAAGAAPSTGPSPEGTTRAQVVLTGLKEDLQAGRTYPVVLTFQRAGDVTLQVPVGNPGEGSPAE